MPLSFKRKALIGLLIVSYLAAVGFYVQTARAEKQNWQSLRQQQLVDSPAVFVTPSGKRYHRAHHYRDRTTGMNLYEATEAGFTPCQVCRPGPPAQLIAPLTVLYADWGTYAGLSLVPLGLLIWAISRVGLEHSD